MEPLFVAEWKYDKKTIYELISLFRKNSVLSSTATSVIRSCFFCTMPYIRTSIKNSNVFQILQKLFLRTG